MRLWRTTLGLLAATGLACLGAARPAAPPAPARAVTFARDVAPILYQNCAACHRPGQAAPFSLLSYTDAKKRARQIALITQDRTMPPWKAASHGEFVDERRLTDAQIALLQTWSAQGAPLGNPRAAPPAPRFATGWRLGVPDTEVRPSRPYALAGGGDDVYRCFVLPTRFAADRWVSAVQVRPGNAKVVHHVIVYLDTTGKARRFAAQAQGVGPGFDAPGFTTPDVLGIWAPGNDPRRLPVGVGILLPKGADIVLQVHYHKDGRPESDLTRIGLYFSKAPVDKPLRIFPLAAGLWIPPGDAHYATHAALTVPADATLLEVAPHMHLLGRTMAVTAAPPGGQARTLVDVPDWDFNWQSTYVYKEPVRLPKGTQIRLTATYDNSASNPRNPNSPPRLVTWGERTADEMCIAFLFYTVDSEHARRVPPPH